MHHVIDLVLLAELASEGQAGEVLQPVPVDGVDVEPDEERGEQANVDQEREQDEDPLPVLVEVPEGDVGQEGEGQQQAAQEAEDVGNVVDPGQEAAQEEEEDDAHQFEEGLTGVLQHLPALEELHKQTSQQPKLGPGWSNLNNHTGREILMVKEGHKTLTYLGKMGEKTLFST